jgi:hypothetical protein
MHTATRTTAVTMTNLRLELNHYLFLEFGVDGDESSVTETWPFRLQLVHEGEDLTVFEFEEDKPYFAIAGDALDFMSQAGMTVHDLLKQHRGSVWIGSRGPVDLDTSRLGETAVPPAIQRRKELELLGSQNAPGQAVEILEGLYLEAEAKYLGLFRVRGSEEVFVAGLVGAPISVPFPAASAWRRLAWGVGSWLQQ